MMSRDCGVDQLAAMGFKRCQRAHFIDAHQPTVTDDIRSQNGRKSALGGLSFHESSPAGILFRAAKGLSPAWGRAANNLSSPRAQHESLASVPAKRQVTRQWPLFAHSGRLES